MALTRLSNQSLTSISSLPAAISTGKVLQIQTTTKENAFSTTSTSFVDITGLSVSITPTSSSNKIFVMSHIHVSHGASRGMYVQLVRGSTELHRGEASSNRIRATVGTCSDEGASTANAYTGGFQYLDSPATTSATTYKLQARIGSTNEGHINKKTDDQDNDSGYRFASGITVMEIEA